MFLDSCYNADYFIALKPGDSGAWVVDDTTNEVYGHIVASDVFGVAYVVPIEDIFEDIKLRLSLEVVDLPFGGTISEIEPEIEATMSDFMTINGSNLLLGVDKNNGAGPAESGISCRHSGNSSIHDQNF